MSPHEFEFRVPEFALEQKPALEFRRFLDEGGIKDVAKQRSILERILTEKVTAIEELYVRTMGRQSSQSSGSVRSCGAGTSA